MNSKLRLLALFFVGALALGGCSALRSIFAGDAGAAEPASPEVESQPGPPRFTFFDSWASW